MGDYIICYDIADPRRLGRIHRALKKQATPVQYSVFLFCGSDQQLQRCLDELQRLMDPHADDIRAYRAAPARPAPGAPMLGNAARCNARRGRCRQK